MRLVLIAVLAAACSSKKPEITGPPGGPTPPPVAETSLRDPLWFEAIPDRATRSRALFTEVSRVLLHPRCVNCHPPDDVPRQGDKHVFHDPPAVRGDGGRGVVAMQCRGCHQDRNLELARVPGAPDWHLAPLEMAWLGKSTHDICEQVSDPKRNGGKTLAQIHTHLTDDKLVAWGWQPGADRVPAPGSQKQLAALFQAWMDTGAVCPEVAR